MKVGFIGLGHMGVGMAANLAVAGHDVSLFNRTPGRAGRLVELGAREVASLAAACNAEAVITMLADDDAVSNIALGDGGLVAHLPKDAIHVSMSSISVALSERLARAHAEAGQRYIAAPVFGRPAMAAAGKLFIIVAGAAETIDVCRPLFQVMGQKVIRIGGDSPAANLVKLSGNFLTAAAIEAMGEAVALVRKAGIDPRTYIELLTATVFNGAPYTIYGPLIAAGKFEPAAFAAPLAYKDIRLALAAAESLRVPMPLGSLLHDRFLRLLQEGGDRLDWAALAALAEQDAGVEPLGALTRVREISAGQTGP
ncbi:MAG TPA: NAD(P)-dependent oxidoreductase [Steroidobacteraceae bacterium]|jgi:3-hydroxyisobutyrate dehydrogenase-like beta-hydroxyacid dehydrogenase|nr:NAD(P)-dependent oxidoreductase [Steroidobacteraceae bacterium]